MSELTIPDDVLMKNSREIEATIYPIQMTDESFRKSMTITFSFKCRNEHFNCKQKVLDFTWLTVKDELDRESLLSMIDKDDENDKVLTVYLPVFTSIVFNLSTDQIRSLDESIYLLKDRLAAYIFTIWLNKLLTACNIDKFQYSCCLEALSHGKAGGIINHFLFKFNITKTIEKRIAMKEFKIPQLNLFADPQRLEPFIIEVERELSTVRNTIALMMSRIKLFRRYIHENGLMITNERIEDTLCNPVKHDKIDRSIESGELIKFITACDTHTIESTVTRPGFVITITHCKECKNMMQHTNYSNVELSSELIYACGFFGDNYHHSVTKIDDDEKRRPITYKISKPNCHPPKMISIEVNIHSDDTIKVLTIQVNSGCEIKIKLLSGKDEISEPRISKDPDKLNNHILWYGLAMTIGKFKSKYEVYMTTDEIKKVNAFDQDLHLFLRIHEDAIEPYQA